ncbi:MAG TPA: biotin--[acetyl-CoA-carboxylase] ligase [Chthonomonadales bacterium]|nr:biotin--[acetyl-CoA-carboxylase] ligase [Chthonomonadales bacterium]
MEGSGLLELECVTSTQDVARERVLAGDRGFLGVRANFQTAGRGRLGREWHAEPGLCLLVSYVLRGADCTPPMAHSLAFVAGVAVAQTISAVAGGSPSLKWPNDVLLAGRKVAGVLIETLAPHGEPVAIVGIGVNVNALPVAPELASTAASLREVTGEVWDIRALEARLRDTLCRVRQNAVERGWSWLLDEWRMYDATAGRRYVVELGGAPVACVATGIAPDGSLQVWCGERQWTTFAATAVP